jgi:hypothetical protein
MTKLKKTEGYYYYEELPENTILCSSIRDFFRIKKGRKKWKKENVEAIPEVDFLIYSPTAGRYFLRKTHECTNYRKLIGYIKDKNLYLFTDVSNNME